jgi:hypothetical protein
VSHGRSLGGVGLAFVAVAALAAGCGSGTKTSPTSATPSGGNAMANYFTCLRNNGVNVPQVNPSGRPTTRPSARPSARPSGAPRPSGSPGDGRARGGFPGGFGGVFGSTAPSGVSQEAWDKARKACASLEPSFNPQGRGRDNGAFAAYRNCLSDHGVTLNGPGDQLSTADPKTAAALQACAPLRPSARPSAS